MKRVERFGWLALASIIAILPVAAPAHAQLAVQVTTPQGVTVPVSGRNVQRPDNALILYDPSFGKSTRTNAFGVEVVAVPGNPGVVANGEKTYVVKDVTSAWRCGNDPALSCGNAEIPADGIVLSAMGTEREALKSLKPGDRLTLVESWTQQKTAKLNVINPSPQNNPMGSGFPGFRASNQIVAYDAGYGRSNTGTNEFGFEVTVRNGIVTEQEGSDSSIPGDNGFVLSGHGAGRGWLIANAPLGAKIQIGADGQTVTSIVDFDSYLYQFNQTWAASPCSASAWSATAKADGQCTAIQRQKELAVRANESGMTGDAGAQLSQALESLNRRIWLSYQPFPNDSLRGVWHRPVEKNAVAINKTLDTLKAAGINAIFLETFFHGYTIFPSETFKKYGMATEDPKFDGVDILKLWVDGAHARGMQIHTWFQTFYGGTKAYLSPGPILSKHPEWANVQYSALITTKLPTPVPSVSPLLHAGAPHAALGNLQTLSQQQPATLALSPAVTPPMPGMASTGQLPVIIGLPTVIRKAPGHPVPSSLELGGYFLDPANPQVQTFLKQLADEIVTRYDIDGFQLDYIRYPASFPSDRFSFQRTTWGYTDVARAQFKAQYGIDPADIDPKRPDMAQLWMAWGAFKVQQVNSFVSWAATDLHKKHPGLKLSAAVFPDANAALTLKHQDWALWGRNGWIDFFAPMTLTSGLKVIDRDTRTMVQATDNRVPVYSGIFGPFNDNSAELVLSQIDTARMAGANGFVLFDSAHLTPRTLEALHTMQSPRTPMNNASSFIPTPPVAAPLPGRSIPAHVNAPIMPESAPKKKHWWN